MDESDSESINFQLVDKKSGEKLNGSLIIFGESPDVRKVDEMGILLEKDLGQVSVEFKADGYFSYKSSFNLDTMLMDQEYLISLDPIQEGNVITLSNVLFHRGTANFIEGSEEELDLVVEMMSENPNVKIFLKGHTDNVGNAMLNVELSQERVYSVTDYLVSKGIDSSRIDGEGYGGEQPVASNSNESTRKLNRRVEFEIVKVN